MMQSFASPSVCRVPVCWHTLPTPHTPTRKRAPRGAAKRVPCAFSRHQHTHTRLETRVPALAGASGVHGAPVFSAFQNFPIQFWSEYRHA